MKNFQDDAEYFEMFGGDLMGTKREDYEFDYSGYFDFASDFCDLCRGRGCDWCLMTEY